MTHLNLRDKNHISNNRQPILTKNNNSKKLYFANTPQSKLNTPSDILYNKPLRSFVYFFSDLNFFLLQLSRTFVQI